MMPANLSDVNRPQRPSSTNPASPTALSPANTADAVDCHFHVFRAGVSASADVRYVPAYDATLADWQRRAAQHALGRGVIVQTSFLGTDNSDLLAALAASPCRLRGVAALAPSTPATLIAELDAQGVRGIRFNLAGRTDLPDDAHRRLIERIAEAGWHVELHTDPGGLAPVLASMPAEVTVVVDHFGRPAGDDDLATWHAIEREAARLYVKLSAPYRLNGQNPAPLARRWRDLLGPDRLLWGSDWPCTNHESQAATAHRWTTLHDWLDDADVVRRVMVDNPERLYRFDAARP